MRYKYLGADKIFLQYKDAETGNTLDAKHGEVYDVVPVSPELPELPYGQARHFEKVVSEDDVLTEVTPDPEPIPVEVPVNTESDGE